MKIKLSRAAALIDKYGFRRGLGIYCKLRSGNVSNMVVPGIQHPFSLRKGTSDTAVFEQVFLRDEYDMEFSFVPKVIVDAGANIGLFSIIMKNKFPASKIICVEPDKDNCEMLKKNLSKYNNVDIVCAGLWNSDTKLNVIDKHNMGYSALVVEEDINNGCVPAITVDAIIKAHGISHVDILKIDIEGSESIVFSKNYEQWLPKVKMIIIELHDWLKPGCSQPFFEAVQKTFENYLYSVCGENTIIQNNDLK